MAVPVLVAVAWPYASGSRHLGHLAGAYLPADIYARYQRLAGNNVLMVSGSDVHGTPITVRADAEGVTPSEIVEHYHSEFCDQREVLGISWDLYTTTGTRNHAEVTQDMFLVQLKNGHIDKRVSEQFYDPVGERFLPDRYIEGTCPRCGYGAARGDQCEHCGTTLDATDLIEPRSKISGAVPELRSTEHFYYRYSDFTERVADWLETRRGWRPHVLNSSFGWTNEGLQDRAITRDLDWGVELPVDDLGEGKRIYVWYDAVIGYLSASKEWAARGGDPDAWKRWWHNDESRHLYFVGKDNIPFHAMLWPAQLMGYGGLHLPDNVPANQYVTFSGAKMAAGRGVGLSIGEGLRLFEPDALRYALAAEVHQAQMLLGHHMSLVSGLAVPGNGQRLVFRYRQSLMVGACQQENRLAVAVAGHTRQVRPFRVLAHPNHQRETAGIQANLLASAVGNRLALQAANMPVSMGSGEPEHEPQHQRHNDLMT